VLAGEIAPAIDSRSGQWEAPRLAAGDRERLVDLHLEAALDQLVGSAQARDPAAEDDDLLGHGP
jgi:hypothetical protein